MSKKRCLEEFNPWPAFVDIFSSVIMVLLLFLLITIVNVAYYGQFKYKVSYTQTIPAEELIKHNSNDYKKEFEYTNLPQIVTKGNIPTIDSTKNQLQQKTTEQVEQNTQVGEIVNAGKNLSKIYEDETTKQKLVINENYIVLNFGSNDVKLDNQIILQIKKFIKTAKQKYPNHILKINAIDPTNQLSMTVTKQISLARTLNTRNMLRELGYNLKDIRIDLRNPKNIVVQNDGKSAFGYIVILVEGK